MTAAAHPGIHIGGSELLLNFLELALRHSTTRLDVIAPYMDEGAWGDDAVRRAWCRTVAASETTVVVRTAESAAAAHRALPHAGRRHEVLINRRVHTKLLLARRAGVWLALTGSLNLTGAALHTNIELGILFTSGVGAGAGDRYGAVCRRLGDVADDIKRESLRIPTRSAVESARSAPERSGRRPSPGDGSLRRTATCSSACTARQSPPWHE